MKGRILPTGKQIINKSHPLANGLVVSIPLNEGGGTVVRDCAVFKTENITSGNIWKQSILGNAFYVNGATGGGFIPLTTRSGLSNLASSQMSISAWCTSEELSGTTRYIVGNFNAAGTLSAFLLNQSASKFQFGYTGAGAIVAGTTVISGQPSNTIYHIVGVRTGASGAWTNKIYVNGKLENSLATATNPPAYQNTSIGRAGAIVSGFRWFGYLNNVQIWNRPLTDSEVVQLYVAPFDMYL